MITPELHSTIIRERLATLSEEARAARTAPRPHFKLSFVLRRVSLSVPVPTLRQTA